MVAASALTDALQSAYIHQFQLTTYQRNLGLMAVVLFSAVLGWAGWSLGKSLYKKTNRVAMVVRIGLAAGLSSLGVLIGADAIGGVSNLNRQASEWRAARLASIVEHGHMSVQFTTRYSEHGESIDRRYVVVVDTLIPVSTTIVLGHPVAAVRTIELSLREAQLADSVIRDVTGGQVALASSVGLAP